MWLMLYNQATTIIINSTSTATAAGATAGR
jgi:hypothetical protein